MKQSWLARQLEDPEFLAGFQSELIDDLSKRVLAAEAKLAALAKAAESVNVVCSNFYHSAEDTHRDDETCPVNIRFLDAVIAATKSDS